MTVLKRHEGYYNPFFLTYKDKEYEVYNIIIYDGERVMPVGRGWFGANNELDQLTIPDVILRRKEILDGKTFIIRVKDRGRATGGLVYLYIPFDYFCFEEKKGTRQHCGFLTRIWTQYVSRLDHRIYFELDYHEEVDNDLLDAAIKARKQMDRILAVAERLERKCYDLDPYHAAARYAEERRARNDRA